MDREVVRFLRKSVWEISSWNEWIFTSSLVPRSMTTFFLACSSSMSTMSFTRPVVIFIQGTARRSQCNEIGSMICGTLNRVLRRDVHIIYSNIFGPTGQPVTDRLIVSPAYPLFHIFSVTWTKVSRRQESEIPAFQSGGLARWNMESVDIQSHPVPNRVVSVTMLNHPRG